MDFIAIVSKHMRHVRDIPRVLLRIKKVPKKGRVVLCEPCQVAATLTDWHKLFHSLESTLPILDTIDAFLSQARFESFVHYVSEAFVELQRIKTI